MTVGILGSLSNPYFFFVFFLQTIVLAIAFSFSIFLIFGKVYSCSTGENYIVMAKRKRFSTDRILSFLRSVRDDVSECEDSESELDDLYNPELDSDSSFSDEYESELSESIISDSDSLDPPSKRRRTPFRTTEAPQKVDNDAEMNSFHNQEENDGNSGVASDTPQSELPSLDVGGTARKSVLITSDGTEWLQITSDDSSVGRCSQHNILRETSGLTSYTKRNVFAGSPASAWRLLVDDFILKHIAKSTIFEAHRQLQDETFALTIEELKAFIAVMYARGPTGKSALPLHDLWTENWSVPLCKSAMSRNRFCEFLRFFRFDVKSNRSHRIQTNKLALFSEVCAYFMDICCALYKPGAFITVDEQQLFPSKARCSFTQYML